MARNGSGTYNRTQDDYAFGEVISETEVNSELNDIAAALTQSLSKDGQTTATGNQPMGGFRHTGVGAASARDQYLQAGQAQDGAPAWCGTAGGTADARTLTPTPAITAYAAGQRWVFKNGAAANTTATPTVTISGLGTSRTVKRSDGTALAPGDMGAGALLEMVDDGTNLLLMTQTYEEGWVLLQETTVGGAVPVVDMETGFGSTYDDYVIIAEGVRPATDGATFGCQLKIGGAYQGGSGYYGHVSLQTSSAATYNGAAMANAGIIQLTAGVDNANSASSASLTMDIYSANQSVTAKNVIWRGSSMDLSANVTSIAAGSASYNVSTAALSGVRFSMSTGNINAGTFRLYGIVK